MDHNYAANKVEVEIDVHEENANILQQGVIETYTTLPGVRLKSLVYMDNLGYRYYKNNSCNNKKSKWCDELFTYTYTFLQSQASVQRMRHCRRPPNPDTIEELAGILNEHNMAYASTLQRPPSSISHQLLVFRFFQQLFEAEGETVGIVFFNFDAIEKYRNELLSVRIAGIGGAFKTVPKRPPQFTKGCLLSFHVLFHNVVNYERGLMNVVRSIFIESNLQGCWFHYCQAVIWYCRRTLNSVFHLFQNSPEAHRVLRMVLVLPYLPAKIHPECQFIMAEGFNTIVEYANGIEEISERLQSFLIDYI
ncbi:hypothetical protein QTP88_022652 [Uroleucon formosanum]